MAADRASSALAVAATTTRRRRCWLGVVDASVIALAERHGVDTIATLDHRHFGTVKPRHADGFTLLP